MLVIFTATAVSVGPVRPYLYSGGIKAYSPLMTTSRYIAMGLVIESQKDHPHPCASEHGTLKVAGMVAKNA